MIAYSPPIPGPLPPRIRARYLCDVTHSARTGLRHLRIRRQDGGRHFPWWHLQALKNELLGEEVYAVEVFPPQNDVIDVFNFRHLWEVQDGGTLPNMGRDW